MSLFQNIHQKICWCHWFREFSKGRLTPTDLAERLDRSSAFVVRSLKEMRNKNCVIRVGMGKRAYYSLTTRGDTAMKRYERST